MKRLTVFIVISLFCFAVNAAQNDNGSRNNNKSSTKAQDHNASRSNTSSSKAQDHNASRSNASSSSITVDNGTGSAKKKPSKEVKKEKCKGKKCEKRGHVTVLK